MKKKKTKKTEEPTMTQKTKRYSRARQRELRLYHARNDINAFIAYVFQQNNAKMHRRWHRRADKYPNLVLHAPVEHGKTLQMATYRVLFKLGHNPDARIAIVSNTAVQAQRILGTIKEMIESNARFHEVFPNVRPGRPWRQDQITVARTQTLKDPSVQALGVCGPINGSRLNLIVLDDILSYTNTLLDKPRIKTFEWIQNEVINRLLSDGRLIAIGTAWKSNDAMFELAKLPGFHHHLDKAIDDDGNILWPEEEGGWSRERLEARRKQLGEFAFSRQFQNEPRNDALARCHSAWIEQCIEPSLQLGQRVTSDQWQIVTGVDLAVGPGRARDLTCLFTIASHRKTKVRRVIDIQAGQWQKPEIIERIVAAQREYCSTVVVESNGAQEFIVQDLREVGPSFPVRAHQTTAANKHHEVYGVESVFSELERKKWEIPDPEKHPEVAEWIAECVYFAPDSHTGDRLMACWIAREELRRLEEKDDDFIPVKPVVFLKSDPYF